MANEKPLPADWLEYIANIEREMKRAPNPLKSHRPHIQRHQSKRMRSAFQQTNDGIKAIYGADGSPTPLATGNEVWTKNLGGNCEDRNSLSGKATDTRGTEGKGEIR
jgi:hypothetical protein